MTQKQLVKFIEDRKDEKTKLMSASAYFRFLRSENYIDKEVYKSLAIGLNNRYIFLERSILDHEKLITK